MSTKRVFILGAGFSAQADMPLATRLFDFIREDFQNQQDALHWLDFLKKRLDWLKNNYSGKSNSINIEQVFDLAPYDIMVWRMRQSGYPSNVAGNVAEQYATDIEKWLQQMDKSLWNIIFDKQNEAVGKLNLVSRFSEHLSSDDVVITFNYDTLLEASLSEQKRPWYYGGFDLKKGQSVCILKMHGSINWLKVPDGDKECNDTQRYERLYSSVDILKCFDSTEKPKEILYHLLCHRECSPRKLHQDKRFRDQPGYNQRCIAGLGRYKPLDRLPGSWKVWSNAMKELEKAEDIYVIGFSLSPFDSMARLHFAGVMCGRNEKGNLPKMITLVDPHARELEADYRSVFGNKTPIKLCEKEAQNVDWVKLLS